jgi:hypothetical protein
MTTPPFFKGRLVLTIRACSYLIVALLYGERPAMAEPKNDLVGFHPGMSKAAVEAKMANLKCDVSECKVADGSVVFGFARDWPAGGLVQVKYTFISGLDPKQMIDSISGQFAAKPDKTKGKADIALAMRRHVDQDPYSGKPIWVVGGDIAHWTRDDGLDLTLAVNDPSAATEYILTLTNSKMVAAREVAIQRAKAERDAKLRKINTNPKF